MARNLERRALRRTQTISMPHVHESSAAVALFSLESQTMKTQIILSLLATTIIAADALKLPNVEQPKIKLPEGWTPPSDSHIPRTFGEYLLKMGEPFPVISFSANVTIGSGWLVIHPGEGESAWTPEAVLLESKNEPVITRIGDRWVIRFKRG